jgi:hypothetical protein
MSSLTHMLLVDSLIDAYVSWRESCSLVNGAYRAWASAARTDAAVAFTCYSAALDGEERAAAAYADLAARVWHIAATSGGVDREVHAPKRSIRRA